MEDAGKCWSSQLLDCDFLHPYFSHSTPSEKITMIKKIRCQLKYIKNKRTKTIVSSQFTIIYAFGGQVSGQECPLLS